MRRDSKISENRSLQFDTLIREMFDDADPRDMKIGDDQTRKATKAISQIDQLMLTLDEMMQVDHNLSTRWYEQMETLRKLKQHLLAMSVRRM